MSWKVVSIACCAEDIQITNESYGWIPSLEAECYV